MNFKRILLCVVMAMVGFMALHAELNSAQRNVRSQIYSFLSEEGYQPTYDSDGDIKVKIKGSNYFVRVNESDENPMFVTLASYINYPEDYSRAVVKEAAHEINLYKGVKMLCFKDYITIRAEMFLRSAEPFKQAFYRLIALIQSAEDELDEDLRTAQRNIRNGNI